MAAANGRTAEDRVENEDREHSIKAAFLLHFIRYTTWPRKSFEDDTSPIRVQVVGGDPFGQVLEDTFRGEKAHGREIRVVRSPRVPAELDGHLVFCGELSRGERSELLRRSRGQPILLIGEVAGLAEEGACINFYLQDQKTAFEINVDAVAEASLELSPKVLKLARIVRKKKEDR